MFVARVCNVSEEVVRDVTSSDVRELLAKLAEDGAFLIVERPGALEFVQTMLSIDRSGEDWIIERHDPEREEHVRADTSSRDWVVAAVTGWMDATPRTADALDWFDISADHRPPWWVRLFRRRRRGTG